MQIVRKFSLISREGFIHLDDENVKVVDSLDVILRTDFGDVVGIEEPAEVDLGVGVTVVKNHGEEFSGWLQRGFLVHLIIDLIATNKRT